MVRQAGQACFSLSDSQQVITQTHLNPMNTKRFFVTVWSTAQEENYAFPTREEAEDYFEQLKPGMLYERFSHYPVFAELSSIRLCPLAGLQSDMLNLRKVVA